MADLIRETNLIQALVVLSIVYCLLLQSMVLTKGIIAAIGEVSL